jgi:uncharacterized protein YjgD (DUF1641 family)
MELKLQRWPGTDTKELSQALTLNHQLNMAQPITLELPARDPRAELQTRLQNAPLEHAEALLAAYEALQGLHDRGVFELLRGALGSSDRVIEIIVEAAKTPDSIRGIRNVIILAKILGTIEPELLEGFAKSLPEAIAFTKAHESKPPGIWGVLTKFGNRDFRRGLLLVNSMLEAFGRNLPPEGPDKGQPSS